MGVEHIRIGAATLLYGTENEEGVDGKRQLVLDELIGVFTIQQTGPGADLPPHRPSCRYVATSFQRLLGSLPQLRRAVGGNLVRGKKAIEV